jgi:catechol 2,3-dioxygenase-like lactoylglutathione lyase family enzyme
MKSYVGHLQFNIRPVNKPFYAGLFQFLGWNTLYEEDTFIGLGNESAASLWFMGTENEFTSDHDGLGLNHLGINVGTKQDVDSTVEYLNGKGVKLLFGTPCNRPEYTSGEDDLYYSAMFESPDRILLEVVYTGPKV